MADRVVPGPVENSASIREAVCVNTRKIFDSCRDKDCVDDLRVYPTVSSQSYIENALSIRPKRAELLYVDVSVEPVGFNRGYFTVDCTYFYRVTGETFPGGQTCTGLCVFDKRVMLFGSIASVKSYSSDSAVPLSTVDELPIPSIPSACTARSVILSACCRLSLSSAASPQRSPRPSTRALSLPTPPAAGLRRSASSASSGLSATHSCSFPPMTTACPIRSAPARSPRMIPARSSAASASRSRSSSRPTASATARTTAA